MELKVWCDSGANIHSCRTVIIDVEDTFGLSDDEWKALTEDEQTEMVKDIAWERLDWGFKEI